MPTTHPTPAHLSAFARAVRLLPFRAARALAPRPLVTLTYHAVSDAHLPHIRPLYDYKSTADFEADLRAVREHYQPVGEDDVRRNREENAPLPTHALTVTFDDGLRECVTEARPLLLRYGIPSTFFVVGNLIDNRSLMFRHEVALALGAIGKLPEPGLAEVLPRLEAVGFRAGSRAELVGTLGALSYSERDRIRRMSEALGIDVDGFLRETRPYLTADEILGLHREGFTIGAHSLTHSRLSRLDDFDAVATEIVESCAMVRDLTGQERVPFAFPFNGLSLDRDALAGLRRVNPFVGLLYDTNTLMRDRPFIVNRIDADSVTGTTSGVSNLPLLLKIAHVREPIRRIKHWIG
ncbi:MAG: polysaccharide deacetylase family protein [Acidimicrobiia bacterium]|nr:polysaccharide deacetylase family protein [Acidimicrobiia bacterium]